MYSIFQVFDYKGGELNTVINLTKPEFISHIIRYYFEEIEGETIDELKQNILVKIKDEDFYGEYAGWETKFCGEIFEHINNQLISVGFENFVDEIAQELHRSNLEYKELQKNDA